MHLFFAIVAAGITLYLLRNWWERLQYQRQERRIEQMLNPAQWGAASEESMRGPQIFAGAAIAILVIIAAITFSHYGGS